eukprot:307748-Amphidinium_carterae.4
MHHWISNFFNSTCGGTNNEHGTIGALIDNETEDYDDEYKEQYVIAFKKWYNGKGNKNNKGKAKVKTK